MSLQNTATKRNDEEKQFQLMENFHKFRPSRHSQRASTAFFQFFCVRRLWREKGGNEWGLYVAQVSVEFEAQDWLLTVDFGRHDEQFNSARQPPSGPKPPTSPTKKLQKPPRNKSLPSHSTEEPRVTKSARPPIPKPMILSVRRCLFPSCEHRQ